VEKILAYLRLKLYFAQQKSRRYGLNLLRTKNITERHQLNVELSYILGKIAAYREIEAFIDNDLSIQPELKQMVESLLAEAAFEWKLKQITANPKENDANFDELVEIITKKLLDVLLPEVDITILDVPKKEKQRKRLLLIQE
jgi:hypothetical protein